MKSKELSDHRRPRKHCDKVMQDGTVPTGLELKRDIVGKSGHSQIKPEV